MVEAEAPGGKVTLIPGTILRVPSPQVAAAGELPFATAGAAQSYTDLDDVSDVRRNRIMQELLANIESELNDLLVTR